MTAVSTICRTTNESKQGADGGNTPVGPFPYDLESLLEACDEVERLAVANPGEAVELGTALVAQADMLRDPHIRVRSRRAVAQANAYAGKFDLALHHCGMAIEIGSAAGIAVETARARLASLHSLANLGRFEEAIETGLVARASFEAAGERELTARADLNLGAVYAMNDDPVSALMYLDRARSSFSDQPAILAQLDTNRGNALTAIDDFAGAEAAFVSAVRSFEVTEQHLGAAIAEGNLGYLAARRGLIQTALRHFEIARRMLHESDARAHRARLIAEQAEIIGVLGLNRAAIRSLEEVIPDLDATFQRVESARARIALANGLISMGQLPRASTLIDEAISTFTDLGQQTDLGRAKREASELACHTQDVNLARTLIDESRELLADRPADIARTAIVSARISLSEGDENRALSSIDEALSIARRLELTPIEAEAQLLMGRWLRSQGRPALTAFLEAVELTERIRGTLQAGVFRSAFQGDRLAPYTELLNESTSILRGRNPAIAFEASELVRSRALLDTIELRDESTAEQPREPSAETELRRRIASLRERLNWHYSRALDFTEESTPHRVIRELEEEIQRLQTQLSATSGLNNVGHRPVKLEQALAVLSEGTIAVSFNFIDDELIALLLVDGECVIHRDLAGREVIEEAIRRFQLQVARAHARAEQRPFPSALVENALRELHRLWTILLEPILQDCTRAKRLIVVPAGPLHAVPFGALWTGASYLVEEMSVNVVPSISVYTRLPEATQRPVTGATLVVGVSDERAPLIPVEVQQVASISAAQRVLLNETATADSVGRAMLSAETMHFACHGRYSREFPAASGLKCHDRWLTFSEISRLDLRDSHITLSACDTGKLSVDAIEDQVGLASGFYGAGARSMVTTLWPVNDSRTVELMSTFYEQRSMGNTFEESLRKAQLAAIQRGDHPAHWAPFVFGGRG